TPTFTIVHVGVPVGVNGYAPGTGPGFSCHPCHAFRVFCPGGVRTHRDTRVAARRHWLELGRYRLDEQVGQGGMAVVWRGWDTQLRRTVAVKVLHAHLHAREEIRRRFDLETHAVARLHHPFTLDVYDFSGPHADPSFLVTDFIR